MGRVESGRRLPEQKARGAAAQSAWEELAWGGGEEAELGAPRGEADGDGGGQAARETERGWADVPDPGRGGGDLSLGPSGSTVGIRCGDLLLRGWPVGVRLSSL